MKVVRQGACVYSAKANTTKRAASSGNFLPTFRDNLSLQSSRLLLEIWTDRSFRSVSKSPGFVTLEDGVASCPETWVRNYHYSMSNTPEERSSYLLLGKSWKSSKGTFCLRHRPRSHTFCPFAVLKECEILDV